MFPCYSPVLRTLFQIIFNLLLHQSLLTVNQNMKSWKSLTLNWITGAAYANYYIWSSGPATKVPMRKPLGCLLMNFLMLLASSPTSISNIHPNLALFTFSKTPSIFFLILCYYFFNSVHSPFIILFLNSVIHTRKKNQEKTSFKILSIL